MAETLGLQAQAWVFLVLPLLIAAGASAVTAAIMQARSEVLVSRQREVIAEMRAYLSAQHRSTEDRVRAAEESSRRLALDEFMADVKVENRQFARGRALVIQERVLFRNIPLTGWVEHELPSAVPVLPMEVPTGPRALPGPRRV